MTRSLLAPIALAITMFGTAQAHATDVSFSDFTNAAQTVDIALTAPHATLNSTELAGGQLTSINGGPSFTSYCINLYDSVAFGQSYSNFALTDTSAHSFANANAASDLGKLFAEGNAVDTTTAQAAFQIAIWEIAYETSGSYGLAGGTARFSGGEAATSGALTLAGSWLNALAGTTGSVDLGVLESTANASEVAHQDHVFVAAPVPEPTTYALLAAGLMCVGFVARRRAPKQR